MRRTNLVNAVLVAAAFATLAWFVAAGLARADRSSVSADFVPKQVRPFLHATALVFVAFAVDVLYLFPVALVYDRGFVVRDLVEVIIFVGILSLVIVYAWKKGVFEWNRTRNSARN